MIKNSSLSCKLCQGEAAFVSRCLVAAETRAERAMIDGRVASAIGVQASIFKKHSSESLNILILRAAQVNSRNRKRARPEVDGVGPGLLPFGLAEHLFEIF